MSAISPRPLTDSRVTAGSSEAWGADLPVLRSGDLGFETDTGKFKVGDGATAWPDLPYADPDGPGGSPGESPEIDGGTP